MDSAHPRYLHFLGTLPQFDKAESALEWQLRDLDGQVRRLCGGETGERLLWFVPLVKELKRMSQTRTVRDGDWTGYTDTDRLAVRHGKRLAAQSIPLHLADNVREELSVLDALGRPSSAALPLQVGVPGYVDMALFTFGPVGALRVARSFLDAVAGQLATLYGAFGDKVVFQLEVPAALIAVASTPPPLRGAAADFLARVVVRQVRKAPVGSRFGVHLCLGDLGHQPKVRLRSAGPLVQLANAICRHWPAGRTLEYVHLPMCGGAQPPTTNPKFYAPLRGLKLPADVQVIAGIAHADQDTRTQLQVRTLVEAELGRHVDIATPCGLGRMAPDQAWRAVDSMFALLGD
jgi:hypothetical protein